MSHGTRRTVLPPVSRTGGRVGGSVGFLFVFGQAVVCSLYCTGFGESFAEAVGWNNEWAVRGIAIVTLLVLLGINLAGVKWVIKVQLLLVGCLGISLVDFIIGTFVKTDYAAGVVGYSVENFRNNTGPDYIPGQDFFTVFGVFFPTATGVMAGVNMSGDLKTPNRSIPIGSLSAIGVRNLAPLALKVPSSSGKNPWLRATVLYVLFVLLLGAVCTRTGLQDDFMIAEKVSGVGVLWLLGLYISSLSACLFVSGVGVLWLHGLYISSLSSCLFVSGVGVLWLLGLYISSLSSCLFVSGVGVLWLLGLYISSLSSCLFVNSCLFDFVYPQVSGVGVLWLLGLYISSLSSCLFVSGVGVLWLLGLYISSLSSCLSGLYGAPRVLQCICNENVIPVIKVLGRGRGPNKEPFLAILVCGFISFSFLFVGQLNLLAPIVTINFMLTYAMVDYAYFAVGMSYDMHLKRKEKYEGNGDKKETESLLSHVIDKGKKEADEKYATNGVGPKYGTLEEPKTGSLIDTSEPKTVEKVLTKDQMADELTSSALEKDGEKKGEDAEKGKVKTGDRDDKDPPRTFHYEIYKMPSSWYSFLCNRWVSLIGAIASFVIMFAIQWGYALANIAVYILLYVYIGQANPGVYPGLTDFSLIQWIKTTFQSLCRRGPPPPEQYVVTPMFVPTKMETEQLNEDSEDYQGRGRYHQSTIMKGEEYDQFE
ncbi:hypothetical protein Bbelb_197660 [Branchiostoma belcheri]|nr:hypothetical protein Bbelb_197660 [Branchiostoma belcheri]